MITHIKRLKNRLWVALANSSRWIFLLRIYCIITGKNIGFVTDKTKIVIEGYPRSGNTYIYSAFVLSQPQITECEVAHHVHGAAQIEQAVKRKIPVLLVVRDPKKAIPSLLIRAPHIDAGRACRDYIDFHEKVQRWTDDILIVDFEFAIADIAAIIELLNKKFNKRFEQPDISALFEERVREMVARLDREDTGSGQIDEMKVGMPSKSRARASEAIGKRISQEHPVLIDLCSECYESMSKKP